jgi:hypothetical protein
MKRSPVGASGELFGFKQSIIPRGLDFKVLKNEVVNSPLKVMAKWVLIPGRCYESTRAADEAVQ